MFPCTSSPLRTSSQYVSTFVNIIPMYGFTPIGVIYLGIFWWSLSLLAFSYYRACTTSPGEPRDAMAEEQELLRVKSGMDTAYRR
jgi:hypothetical protein